jgi:hypothetical protein
MAESVGVALMGFLAVALLTVLELVVVLAVGHPDATTHSDPGSNGNSSAVDSQYEDTAEG